MSLLKDAQLLMLLRNYDQEEMNKEENKVDIIASNPESEESVLMRVVTLSKSRSNNVGIDQVKKMEAKLEKLEPDKAIMFGNDFTIAAREELVEEGIEFFSDEKNILFGLNPNEIYLKILNYVNEFCQVKCGHPPKSKADCKGYSEKLQPCPICNGEGFINQHDKRYRCNHCGGIGTARTHYSCNVRLISDNAGFHFKRGWISLLRDDLRSLLEILQEKSSNS